MITNQSRGNNIMDYQSHLSSSRAVLSILLYMKDEIQIVETAHLLANTEFDDVDPQLNLRRIFLLLDCYLQRAECAFDEVTTTLKKQIKLQESEISK